MRPERNLSDERLGELLGTLPPAPPTWVRAAERIAADRDPGRTDTSARLRDRLVPPAASAVFAHRAAPVREPLPAWSLPTDAVDEIAVTAPWSEPITREWAWGGATGSGARVCILDSGVERDHPLVGPLQGAVAISVQGDETVVEPDEEGDVCGHGTACAGIVRSLAPDCELFSVRVLGAGYTGSGPALLAGLRWAVEQGFDVINMSLSTTKRQFAEALHELADSAYFRRSLLVASAHNMPVESYPWRFSSVISVGSHEGYDALDFFYNPAPPVEFFARGVELDVAWLGGGQLRVTGNSFATPHLAGICALIRSKHPELTPFAVKSVLHLTATNVGRGR
jgi:subtilisin